MTDPLDDDADVISQDTEEQDSPNSQKSVIRLQHALKEVRQEAAKRRVRVRELEQQYADAEAVIQELTTGKDTLAAQLRERETALQGFMDGLKTTNERLVGELPEELRDIVPGSLDALALNQWLTTSIPKLTSQRTPPTTNGDAGGRGRGSDGLLLTDDEVMVAKLLKVSPEEYAKRKQK